MFFGIVHVTRLFHPKRRFNRDRCRVLSCYVMFFRPLGARPSAEIITSIINKLVMRSRANGKADAHRVAIQLDRRPPDCLPAQGRFRRLHGSQSAALRMILRALLGEPEQSRSSTLFASSPLLSWREPSPPQPTPPCDPLSFLRDRASAASRYLLAAGQP
jgi:hypothetical protein